MKKTYIIPTAKAVALDLDYTLLQTSNFIGKATKGGITTYDANNATETSGDVEDARSSNLWDNEW